MEREYEVEKKQENLGYIWNNAWRYFNFESI